MDQPPSDRAAHPYRPDGWERDIYGMPAFAQLVVADLERSSRWYQEVLGFADVFTMRGHDGTPFLAHLRWSQYADVLLSPARAPIDGARGRGVTLNFLTPSADEVAARARAARVEPVDGPTDRPWNARDVVFEDPDGYRLTFTGRSASRPAESFDAVVGRMRDRLSGT